MSTLQSIWELYGAFDQALIDDDNPALAATINSLFPGSSSNRGWYREIDDFFFSAPAAPVRTGPNAQVPSVAKTPDRSVPNATAALERLSLRPDTSRPLNDFEKSRLLFGLLALNQVQSVSPTAALPNFDDPEFSAAFSSVIDLLKPPPERSAPTSGKRTTTSEPGTTSVAQTGAVRGPLDENAFAEDQEDSGGGGGDNDGGEPAQTIKIDGTLQSFLSDVTFTFTDRKAWPAVTAIAKQAGFISATVANLPLCEATLATVEGKRCVVVDTEFTSNNVTFEEVLAVVNPYNWHVNYPDFFCNMAADGPLRTDSWGRVLETVSFCGLLGALGLHTALRFFPDRVGNDYACLDYDLDDPTPGAGDGQVVVDRGYINITRTNDGVLVNTRKVCHITNVSAYAQARLVCITGYGAASMEFIAGAAGIPPPEHDERRAFDYKGPAKFAGQTAPVTPPPPPNAVPVAVQVWTQVLEDVTNSYVDLAEKWTSGGLSIQDVTDYSANVGGRLASAPWQILQALTQPPPPSANPNPGQGGGT